MSKFFLSTDSTADLYQEEINALGCGFLPLTIAIERGGETKFLPDNFQSKQEYLDFFEMLKDKNNNVSTSKNNTEIHREYFESLAKAGHMDVLHFTISYGLANTLDNAEQAAEMVKQDYPNFNVKIVESCTTTVGQGMLVRIAAKLRDEGKTLDEAYNYVQEIKHRIQHFIMVDDLFHLKKGGRVSGAAAAIGTMLQIKVVITFDKEGKLKVIKKVPGGKLKCIQTILNDVENFTFDDDCYPIVVHTGCEDFANNVAAKIEQRFGIKPEVRIMGPTIGCHVGAGAVAFAFIAKEQRPY